MSATRLATGLTVALLALPGTAIAQTTPPPSTDSSGGGDAASLSSLYGWGYTQTDPLPGAPTSSLAGTTSAQDLSSPDAADAARAGEIAKTMEHYQRSQPPVAQAAPSDDTPAWPEIAFAGVVLLATAGGIVRVRVRRARRVAA